MASSPSASPQVDPMTYFLERVIPLGCAPLGKINIHWQHTRGLPGEAFDDIKSAAGFARWQAGRGNDTYVCLSTQRTAMAAVPRGGKATGTKSKAIRRVENVGCIRVLAVDLDVKPGGYGTTTEALGATLRMCQATGFPRPTLVVYSGNGLHVYWVLDTPLSAVEHKHHSAALVRFLQAQGIKFDSQCTVDVTRVLRIPGTKNFKDPSNPKLVALHGSVVPHDYPLALLTPTLDQYRSAAPIPAALPPRGAPVPDTDEFSGGLSQAKPVDMTAVLGECGVLRDIYDRKGSGDPEPLWAMAVYAATFTDDPRAWAHEFSKGDPRYDVGDTDDKLQTKLDGRAANPSQGWPKCTSFALHKGTICAGCPHVNKVVSPFNTTRDAPVSNDPGVLLPHGYTQANGWVWQTFLDKEGNPDKRPVLQAQVNDAYLERDLRGISLVAQITLPGGKSDVLRVANASIVSGGPTMWHEVGRSALNISTADHQKNARAFMGSFISHLQAIGKSVHVPVPGYGWDNLQGELKGFALYDKFFTPIGTEELDTSGEDKEFAELFTPRGHLADWQAAAKIVTSMGRPDLDAILATSFAAPLVRFSPVEGVVVAATSPLSGVGKSTVLKIAQAVWGDPIKVVLKLQDTGAHTGIKMGKMRTLPIYWDELQLRDVRDDRFANILYSVTQGADKGRATASLGLQAVGTWRTMMTCASNDSVADYAEHHRGDTAAGVNRVFEWTIQPLHVTPNAATSAVLADVAGHYGHAGAVYAAYLAKNHDKLKPLYQSMQDRLTKLVDATNEDRYWLAAMVTILLGAMLANKINLVAIDTGRLQTHLIDTFRRMRDNRQGSTHDLGDKDSLAELLNDYIGYARGKSLLVTDKIWLQGGQAPMGHTKVIEEGPRTGIFGQYAVHDQKLRVSYSHFMDWARDVKRRQRRDINAALDKYGAKRQFLTIAAGLGYATTQCRVIDIDLAVIGGMGPSGPLAGQPAGGVAGTTEPAQP